MERDKKKTKKVEYDLRRTQPLYFVFFASFFIFCLVAYLHSFLITYYILRLLYEVVTRLILSLTLRSSLVQINMILFSSLIILFLLLLRLLLHLFYISIYICSSFSFAWLPFEVLIS